MIEVVGIRFKKAGKMYYFDPAGIKLEKEDGAIVETARGIEYGTVIKGNSFVPEEAIVPPLKQVMRRATEEDTKSVEQNHKKETEAFGICLEKISRLGLDMKLVDVECNFEGNKTMFFFTYDGRVDFRELVKDLAGIFRNRIELRQIGVRDEAKMIGGIGICGRPYCCSQFLDDFQPVSTKMAKVQSLSLNPTKISGSCGRLMCCLRYEQEAYEELLKKVPKQGAFVETKDGYGTAVQVNLLRQTVKVKLDNDSDDALHLFKANELAAVPGGRPKEGEPLPKVLHYVPEPEEEEDEKVDEWAIPMMVAPTPEPAPAEEEKKRSGNRRRRSVKPKAEEAKAEKTEKTEKPEGGQKASGSRRQKPEGEKQPKPAHQGEKPNKPNRRRGHGRGGAKSGAEQRPIEQKTKQAPAQQSHAKDTAAKENGAPRGGNRRRNSYRKPRHKGTGEPKAE